MAVNIRKIRTYVSRSARMSKAQRQAYDELALKWILNKNEEFDWERHFPKATKRIVEIGFGMGDATRQVAEKHPDWAILGIEVHRPGVAKLLWWIRKLKLSNIFVMETDVVEIFGKVIPVKSVDAIHIWFPDPWPKKRHQKRRLITRNFAAVLAASLRPGGIIHLATDWQHYADEIICILENVEELNNRHDRWAPRPLSRPQTKFEKRGMDQERIIRDIIFEKTLK